MGLRNITVRREEVILADGQKFQVRGLTAFDLFGAMSAYGPQISMLFASLTEGRKAGSRLTNDEVKNAILASVREFPDLIAYAVASASDDPSPEAMAAFKMLPPATQLETVERVFALTFHSEGEVKKLVESLSRMMLAASVALKEATSQIGIGASVAK